MKKNIFSIISVSVLLFAIFGVTMFAFFDKNVISKKENRTLNKLPVFSTKGWFSGDFTKNVNSFLSDHVFQRNNFINYAQNFEYSLKCGMAAEYVSNRNSTREELGSDVIIISDRILALYIRNEQTVNQYKTAVKALFNLVPSNINKYFFTAPSRIEFEKEKYKKYSDNEEADIRNIYESLPKDVTAIDVYKTLVNKNINDVFFRTDHHWTQLGAYYATNAVLTATNHKLIDINNFKRAQGSDFLGYLYARYKVKSLEKFPDKLFYYYNGNIPNEIICYEGQNESKLNSEKIINPSRGGYYTFIGTTSFEYAVIQGKNSDGENILMVSDSYGNSITTWLAEKYNKIVIVDPRYFKGGKSKFLKLFSQYKITDFMADNCILSVTPYFTEEINRLSGVSKQSN